MDTNKPVEVEEPPTTDGTVVQDPPQVPDFLQGEDPGDESDYHHGKEYAPGLGH